MKGLDDKESIIIKNFPRSNRTGRKLNNFT